MSQEPRPTDQPPAARAPGDTVQVRSAMRAAKAATIVIVAVAALGGSLVGWLVAGLPGVWGALLAAGVALIFSGATVWSVSASVKLDANAMMATVMGAWLAKIVVVVAVLFVLGQQTFFDRHVFGIVLLVTVVAGAVMDFVVVQRARVPYTQP